MTEDTTQTVDATDKKTLGKLAMAMWMSEIDKSEIGKDDRKAAFDAVKADYRKKARRLMRQLEGRGLAVTAKDGSADGQ